MSDNIVKQSQLQDILGHAWAKIKERYDDAFVNAEIPTGEKKITFTKRKSGEIKDVSLDDYARLQDQNNFKQDVSSNVGMVDGTIKLGRINGNENLNRISGHRSITTKSFLDGYISHLTVLTDENLDPGSSASWTVWAVEKKENRNNDVIYRKYDIQTTVKTISIDGVNYKAVDLQINETFEKEVYFIVGCERERRYKVIDLKPEYRNTDVVNISNRPGSTGNLQWEDVTTNIAVMYLYGRESIGSLSLKLKQTQADGSLYVLKSETTDGTGLETKAGKVLKLDNNGKINSNLLPAVAINEFISVSGDTWQESIITREYQNGDVIFHENTQKRYLCVDITKDFNSGRFVELNSKDGIVTSINGYTPEANGNIAVTATQNGTGITMTFGSNSGTPVIVATYMTPEEVTEIKNLFR